MWKTLLAIIAFLLVVLFFIVVGRVPSYFTGWTLIIFALYLLIYFTGLSTSLIASTVFTLSLVALVGFVVLFAAVLIVHKGVLDFRGYSPAGIVTFLVVLHLFPVVILFLLDGWPTVAPSWVAILLLAVIYSIWLYVTKHRSVPEQYLLPTKWWSYLLFVGAVFFTVQAVTRSIPS